MKYNLDSFIKKYKARLIVQEFFQIYRIDYIKTFALTIRYKLLRIFLAITAILGMILV